MDDLDSEWRRADVGFALDALQQFQERVVLRTWSALEACGGDRSRLDVPNLAADVVPDDEDEVFSIVHLLNGEPPRDSEKSRVLLYDFAFTCICKTMEQDARS